METFLLGVIKAFVLPPGAIVTGVTFGLVIKKFWPSVGKLLVLSSALFGGLLTLPLVAGGMASWAETAPAIKPSELETIQAEAIVILAGGIDEHRYEYGNETVSIYTLQRVRYGAKLARTVNLPVLVSGGSASEIGASEASYMAELLEREFGVAVKWREEQSKNTAQNAVLTHEILGAKTVILVTHALHMRRAKEAFESVGMRVVPAPVASAALNDPADFSVFDFLPSEQAFAISRYALHELLGILWYRLRH